MGLIGKYCAAATVLATLQSLFATVSRIRSGPNGPRAVTAMALHMMRGGELGILGFCRRERWGHGVHGGARFCCFDAIFVATRGMCDFSFWGEM